MKKIYFISLYLMILSFFISEPAQSQDTLSFEKENFLEKGRFAVVFELGTIFGNSSFFNGYNFLAKYHINNKIAFRINFRIDEGEYNYMSSNTTKWSSYDGDVNANIQYYLSKKNIVNPFLSFGPIFSRNNYYRLEYESKDEYEIYRDNWNIGLIFTLGAEIFIYNNVGIIGEYIIMGTAGKSRNYRKYKGTIQENSEFNIYSFSGKTARLGFSVYF